MRKKNSSIRKMPFPSWDIALSVVRCARIYNEKIALFMLLGLYVGFRYSDLVRVTKSDILNKRVIFTIKKTNKSNYRDVQQGFYSKLNQLKINLDIFPEKLFGSKIPDQYIHISYFARGIKKYSQQVGISEHLIRDISTHSLRKTFARRIYDEYENKTEALIVIAKMFKHKSTETTRDYIGLTSDVVSSIFST